MERKTQYGTVLEALEAFRKQGYTTDFNLEENCIVCNNARFKADEFEIADLYRYEGASDPSEEATVYAIESASGIKGVLVTGYGVYSETQSDEILKKLSR